MEPWLILGLLGILINELANHISGKPIKIDGKKLIQYIVMLALGPATAVYAIYKFFNASPISIKAEEEENIKAEDVPHVTHSFRAKKKNEG
jgi:hypothetical protein